MTINENQVNELIFASLVVAMQLQIFYETPGGSVCGGCFREVSNWRSPEQHTPRCPVKLVLTAANALLETPI
jgi:hypothetical protein